MLRWTTGRSWTSGICTPSANTWKTAGKTYREQYTRPEGSGRVLLCLAWGSIVIALGVNGDHFHITTAGGVDRGSSSGTIIVAGGHIPGLVHGDFAGAGSAPTLDGGPISVFIPLQLYFEINCIRHSLSAYPRTSTPCASR